MDWGLLDCSSKENMLLRDELVYRFRAYYYGAIVEDVIIRFAWILPIVFSHFRIVDVEIITTIVMFAEVTRSVIHSIIIITAILALMLFLLNGDICSKVCIF